MWSALNRFSVSALTFFRGGCRHALSVKEKDLILDSDPDDPKHEAQRANHVAPTPSWKVCFALFAYNQEKFIRDAVLAALAQTFQPLHIILSDDCSSDRTYLIMRELAAEYAGPHSVSVRQNKRNMGIACHINTVIGEANSEFILLAAGDDVSYPWRTTVTLDAFDRNPNATSVFLSADVISDDGAPIGRRILTRGRGENRFTISDLLSHRYSTFGPSRAIRKDAFDFFGELDSNCPTEDTPILLRTSMLGVTVFSPTRGVGYRKHDAGLSQKISLMSMDNDAITAQYERDIEIAREKGLLSKNDYECLRRWVKVQHRTRVVNMKVLSRELLTLSDLAHVWGKRTFRPGMALKIQLRFMSQLLERGPTKT